MSARCPDASTAQALQLIVCLLAKRKPLQHKPVHHTFTQEGVSTVSPQMKCIDHVHVSVADRAAAERWYDAVLGLTRVKELEFWAPGGGPLTIQNHAGTVHLALFEGTPEKRPSTIAFGVDAKEFILWQAHLGEVLATQLQPEDHTLAWSLYFNDPDGNRFEITSYDYEAIERALAKP